MIPAGYMLKRIAQTPAWLQAPQVRAVCSVSHCVSPAFDDYTDLWKHNDFWFFDSPDVIDEVIAARGLGVEGLRLFYYELFEQESDLWGRADSVTAAWQPLTLLNALAVNVNPPLEKRLLGYDVVTWGDVPECSPLSCNHMASELPANAECLFDSFEAAKLAIDADRFKDCEPGLYRIVAVYEVERPGEGASRGLAGEPRDDERGLSEP